MWLACRIGWPSAVRVALPLTAPSSVTRLALQVVPFTHAAGLLEWIEETTPLLDVLTGPSKNFALSLHGRHACAKDYSHVQCWKALADEKQNPNITTLFARQQATFAKVSASAWCLSLLNIVGGAQQ